MKSPRPLNCKDLGYAVRGPMSATDPILTREQMLQALVERFAELGNTNAELARTSNGVEASMTRWSRASAFSLAARELAYILREK